MDDFNQTISNITNTVSKIDADLTATQELQADYQAKLDESILETRDILRRMEKDSASDRKLTIIATIASVIAAIGTIVSIVIHFI